MYNEYEEVSFADKLKNGFAAFKKALMRFFKDVKNGSPIDIAILVGGIVLAGAVIGLCVHLATAGGHTSSPAAESSQSSSVVEEENYDPNANSMDEGEYAGILLPETADAGQSYLEETLFIGDSNTNRMILLGFTTLKNCIGVDNMGVSAVSSLPSVYFSGYTSPVTIPAAVKLMQPKRIIITFGTNNNSWDVATFTSSYTTMIQNLQTAWPYADIIINTVPPIGQTRTYPNVKQSTVDQFNMALADIAKKLDCKFLNSAEVLKDPATGYTKAGYLDTDGIHFNQAGMTALFSYIRTHAYDGEDRRPTLTTVPTHVEAPAPVISDDPLADDSSSATIGSSTSDKGAVKVKYKIVGNGTAKGATAVDLGGVIAFTVKPADGFHIAKIAPSAGSLTVSPNASTGGSAQLKNTAASSGTITITVTFEAHIYDTLVSTTATCNAAGKNTYKCACGATTTKDQPATGVHTWDAGVETTPATCEAAGVKTFTCSGCKKTKTEPIPALGHVWTPESGPADQPKITQTCTRDPSHTQVIDNPAYVPPVGSATT